VYVEVSPKGDWPRPIKYALVALVMGLILSWLWRQMGNMVMPATLHAIIDAVRNVLLL
jgi:membrane protease YdiL (CAAX protease family)